MENINNNLICLLKAYPNAKIYTLTHAEVVCDDYGYWQGQIEKVYYGKFWNDDCNLFLNEKDVLNYQEEYNCKMEEIVGIIILINN